jgi:hypothetical protein
MKKNLFAFLMLFISIQLYAQTDNNDVFSKMRTSTSGNSVYYYDKSSPSTTQTKAFYIYVVKPSNTNPELRVRFQYSGTSGIGIYAYNVMPDKHTSYTVTPPTGQIIKGTGNGYNDFRSYCDLQVGDKFLNILRQIVSAESPKLEYVGRKDNLTVKISKNEVEAISNVLDVYDAFNK